MVQRKKQYKLAAIAILLIAMPLTVFSQDSIAVADFFPLNPGRQWIYSYKSIEKHYFDIAYIDRISTDSGTTAFTVVGDSLGNSCRVWTVQENDTVYRHIQDFLQSTDTSYIIQIGQTFKLTEWLDSLHNIQSQSSFPPLTLPIQWSSIIESPVYRFGRDSTFRSFAKWSPPSQTFALSVGDSILYQRNVGIVFAKFTTSKGPNTPYYFSWEASLLSMLTSVQDAPIHPPIEFSLYQNYPNPFNSSTMISFHLAKSGRISLDIFDLLGRKVKVLADSYFVQGQHSVLWDAHNYSSGIYFCKLSSNGIAQTIKIMLLQ